MFLIRGYFITVVKVRPTKFNAVNLRRTVLPALAIILLNLPTLLSSFAGERSTITINRRLTPHDELFAVHFNASGFGWIVGKHGLILHSRDGGNSWLEQPSGIRKPLTAVSFADDHHGFAVGGGGTILATTDGGITWQQRDSGTREHLLGVQRLDASQAFAVGAFGTLLATANGGMHWRKQSLSWTTLMPWFLRHGNGIEPHLNSVHFIDQRMGWIIGEFGLILHTRNGGRRWRSQRHGGELSPLVSLAFRDHRRGWAVGPKGTLLTTEDGGELWRPNYRRKSANFYAIASNSKDGIIVGQGMALKASDWSSGWKEIDSIPRNLRFSGVALHKNSAVVVGEGGAIHAVNLY